MTRFIAQVNERHGMHRQDHCRGRHPLYQKVELAVRNVIHGEPVKNRDAPANPESLELYRDLPELAD